MKSYLDEQAREFLASRFLSIPTAEKMGVSSLDGEILFPYRANGVVRWKARNMVDKKKQRMFPAVENFKTPFWNQSNWPTSDYLVITEGEFDCIALGGLRALNVVSLPNGAQSVESIFKSQYAYLQQFDVIYICFDHDAAGDLAAEKAKKIIPPEKYRRIIFPPGCKDANDWVKEFSPSAEDLDDLMRNAERIDFDEIVYVKDLPKDFYLARDRGASTGFRDLDRMLGGIRLGELTIVSADTGVGKTTFCINLLCNLLVTDPKNGFWVNSWEMDYKVIARKMASIALNRNFRIKAFDAIEQKKFEEWGRKNKALINPKRSKADVITIRKQIELASRIYGAKYILLDHLDYISGTSKSKENHERISEAVVALHDMAMEFQVHIFLIVHPKQSDGKTPINMSNLKGSSAIKQYADNIIILNPELDIEGKPTSKMNLSIDKNRFLGSKGEVKLAYLSETDSYIGRESMNAFEPKLEDALTGDYDDRDY